MNRDDIPAPRSFLLDVPMYENIEYSEEQVWQIIDVLYFSGTYDSYCTECGKDSTFQAVAPTRPANLTRNNNQETLRMREGLLPEYPVVDPDIYRVHGQCARKKNHVQFFFFLIVRRTALNYSIKKIGQHPSFGDLNLPRMRKYAAVLNAELLGELNRAVALASHDVGVGAYVYLRRVFETLIDEAHKVARQDPGWGDELYVQSRMSEKVVLLKAHLPTFLVEHPEMYSLLSKGIHELSEKECLEHFDTLRIAIELILDETIEKKEKELKIRDAKSALSKAINATKA